MTQVYKSILTCHRNTERVGFRFRDMLSLGQVFSIKPIIFASKLKRRGFL